MHQRPAFADHSAQHVFLSVNNPRPCLGAIVEFVCYYPELLARKYRITSPNWSKDGKLFFIDGNVTVQHTVNTTASRLTLTIFRSWFDGDPAFFDCYFPLVLGGEHRSNSILVHPQGTVRFSVSMINRKHIYSNVSHVSSRTTFCLVV